MKNRTAKEVNATITTIKKYCGCTRIDIASWGFENQEIWQIAKSINDKECPYTGEELKNIIKERRILGTKWRNYIQQMELDDYCHLMKNEIIHKKGLI